MSNEKDIELTRKDLYMRVWNRTGTGLLFEEP